MVARVVLVTLGRDGVLFFSEQMKRSRIRGLDDKVWLRWRGCGRPGGTASHEQRQCQSTCRRQIHPGAPGLVSRRINRTVVPFLISLSIQILPPCASTTFLARAKPSPLPGTECRDFVLPW